MEASGIRLGTAAITSRGLGRAEMRLLAGWIPDILESPEVEPTARRVRGEVAEVTANHPISTA